MMDFRVDLNVFRGPLDLLLYLVRKHEVEIVDIPIAAITDQYLEYLSVLEQLDVDAVGDFLAMAALLIEIKSQQVLPRSDEVQEEIDDPRQELVRRLLEYKKYRDAASMLDERSRQWQQHYPRQASDLPGRQRNLAEEPIQEVELWDLVSAFGRIVRDTAATKPSNIVYDDTPIHVYMARIHARLLERGRLCFGDLFEPGMHRSTMVGIFLAVLELVRHHRIRVEQNALFGEIWILPETNCREPLDLSKVDNYEHAGAVGSG
jgi:segregation and condensation protein A